MDSALSEGSVPPISYRPRDNQPQDGPPHLGRHYRRVIDLTLSEMLLASPRLPARKTLAMAAHPRTASAAATASSQSSSLGPPAVESVPEPGNSFASPGVTSAGEVVLPGRRVRSAGDTVCWGLDEGVMLAIAVLVAPGTGEAVGEEGVGVWV